MDRKIEDIGDDGNRKLNDNEGPDEAENTPSNETKIMDVDEDDDNPQSSEENFPEYQKPYVPGRGIERYNNSLKNLIPVRRKGNDNGTMAIDRAGLFSTLSLSWFSKIMYKAHRREMKMEELPAVSPYDTCNYNADRLDHLWKEELARKGPEMASFSKVVWRFCRTRIFLCILIQIGSIACNLLTVTLFMRKLLEFVQSGGGSSFIEGLKWASLIFATGMMRSIFSSWAVMLNHRTGLRLRSACLTLLYRKIVHLDNLGNKSIGEVINLFSNDAQRIFNTMFLGPQIIEAPILTGYIVVYVLQLFSPMALVGIIVFLMFYPLEYVISRLKKYLRHKMAKISDLRVRLMNEILDCIKLIKMYAWEKRFGDDLLDVRKREQRVLLKTSYLRSLNVALAPTIPIISASLTFLAHVAAGYNLTAAQVFPYSAFLELRFRVTLGYFQQGLESIALVGVSFKRIKDVLLLDDSKCSIMKPISESQAVAISDGKFAYTNCYDNKEKPSEAEDMKRKNGSARFEEQSQQQNLNKPGNNSNHVDVLFDISFEAERGKLVGICGRVGSGKSSLLLAALGQLRVSDGQVMRDGSCAYVSQQAWITNATLRENILFGEKFDHSRYHKAIYTCNLVPDIEMMPAGDQTEIGEKGVNLSGGQKQRVALARALYADRDIYFLDDPLSAVDSRVGAYIFENLILGALKEKTVLFVTHQIQYLNRCDDVYMMQDGRIVEHGTHDELMKLGNEYPSMVAAISSENTAEDESFVDRTSEAIAKPPDVISLHEESENPTDNAGSHTNAKGIETSETPNAQLTVAENLQQGTIKAHVYFVYIRAVGYCLSFVVILTAFANVGSTTLNSWWMAKWLQAGGGNTTIVRNNVTMLSDNINDNPDFWYYQTIYASAIGIVILTATLRSVTFTRATIGASTRMHNDLFKKIISSPMRFFDTTPSGRIQHLFSRDMDEVDQMLPATLGNCIEVVLRSSAGIFVVCAVLPWFILPFSIIVFIYYFLNKRFGLAIGDLKRMENKSRAPVINLVTATVQGLSTIHAFEKENDFVERFFTLFDENSKYLFMSSVAMRWLVTRVEVLTVTISSIVAISVVIFRSQVPPALAGLALAYSMNIMAALTYFIRVITETEIRFTSVERISHYLEITEIEGGVDQPTVKPTSTWPTKAEIKFSNVSMAYGEDAPNILKNISFTVNAGEKIGIVGRTGSGKSSLTVALFRLVEIVEGKIVIDGVDISKISLSQLRTKLSIIPQDPVLFSGTIRSNLDPFKLYSDAEIWEALEKTELKGRVQSINGQLDASVGFGGDNMSVGERQLLCLARALLRNSKILILDEATAAVDPETELAVQNTVTREFSNCTILTIAHRLQTVLSLSRVLVMNDGKVLEFDTPSNLLGDSNSEFSKMMAAPEQTGSQQKLHSSCLTLPKTLPQQRSLTPQSTLK